MNWHMFTCCLSPEHVNSIQIHIILIKIRNFTTKEMISISKLWTSHLSPIMISLIEGCC